MTLPVTPTTKQPAATPGPWTIQPSHAGGRLTAIADSNHVFIAETWTSDRPQGEQEANAALIAAAPDLLESLVELQKQLREHVKLDVKKHYSLMVADAAANTAIAKAVKS